MVGLFFEGAVLNDPNAIVSNQVALPFEATMADEKELVLTYSSNVALDGFKLYFSPALFVENGQNFTPTTQRPDTHYLLDINTNVVEGVSQIENIITTGQGSQSQRNYVLSWQLLSGEDRKVLEITLNHNLTFDLNSYLNGFILNDGVNRLVNKQVNVNVNTGTTSAYDIQKTYGCYIYAEYVPPSFEATITGTNSLSLTTSNSDIDFTNDLPSSGWANDYSIFVNGEAIATYTGLTPSLVGTIDILFGGAGLTNGVFNFSTIRIVSVIDSIDVFYESLESGNTNLEVLNSQEFLPVDLTFYNEGVMNTPAFSLVRGGDIVQKLSNLDDTILNFSAEYGAGTITNARVLLIKISDFNNNIDYQSAYSLDEYNSFSISNSGSIWSINGSIPALDVEAGSDYRIIVLYFDSGNDLVNSFISNIIESLEVGEVENDNDTSFRTPIITDEINNYTQQITTSGVNAAAIHDRYECILSIDKTSYGSDFDDNFLSIKGTIENFTSQGQKQNGSFVITNPNLLEIVTDDAFTLAAKFTFRIQEAWKDLAETNLNWQIFLSTQPNEIQYKQSFIVSDFEQNLIDPDIISIEPKDIDPPNDVIENLLAYTKTFFRVDSTIKPTSLITKQTAILNKNGVIEENSSFPSLFIPQIQDATMQNVDSDFTSEVATYEAQKAGLDFQSCIAVIGRIENLPIIGFDDGICETEPLVSVPPIQVTPTPEPDPPVKDPILCNVALSGGGGAGGFDFGFNIEFDGWIAYGLEPFTIPDGAFWYKQPRDNQGNIIYSAAAPTILATSHMVNIDPTLDVPVNTGFGQGGGNLNPLPFQQVIGQDYLRRTLNEDMIGAGVTNNGSDSDIQYIGLQTGRTVLTPPQQPDPQAEQPYLATNRFAQFRADVGDLNAKIPTIGFDGNSVQLVYMRVFVGDFAVLRIQGQGGTQFFGNVFCYQN